MTNLDEPGFDRIADVTLHALLDALDRVDGVEAELSQGVLTIGFDAGGPPYVVNSHRAAKQIWMAAGRTAWHFDPTGPTASRWTASKPPNEDLWDALSKALAERLGRPVSLRLFRDEALGPARRVSVRGGGPTPPRLCLSASCEIVPVLTRVRAWMRD